jgi:NAD(P)H-nitrite reductase large subunit
MKNMDPNDSGRTTSAKIICYCKHVTQKEIENTIKMGAKTLFDIQKSTKACTGNQCKEFNPTGKCCSGEIIRLLTTAGF